MSETTTSVAGSAAARPYALDEVQAAVRALQAGQFRNAHPTARPHTGLGQTRQRGVRSLDAHTWTATKGERVIAVLGSAGSTGASTVALAIALSTTAPARVIECCSATASGLAAASTAELGLHPSGWRQGNRDQVLIERASEVLAYVAEVPAPTPAEHPSQLTVLDIGWETGQLLATDSWVTDAVMAADQIVVVAAATVPGMRRLEGTLELLAAQAAPTSQNGAGNPEVDHLPADRIWVAFVGPRRKKWPRGIEHASGPATRRALAIDRVIEIPEDRGLAVHGLDSRPVPAPLLSAAARVHAANGSSPVPVADTSCADTDPHVREPLDEHDPSQLDLFDHTA